MITKSFRPHEKLTGRSSEILCVPPVDPFRQQSRIEMWFPGANHEECATASINSSALQRVYPTGHFDIEHRGPSGLPKGSGVPGPSGCRPDLHVRNLILRQEAQVCKEPLTMPVDISRRPLVLQHVPARLGTSGRARGRIATCARRARWEHERSGGGCRLPLRRHPNTLLRS